MKLVILTNDNFFSFVVLKPFLEQKKSQIKLIVFSSALIGKRGTFASIRWSMAQTGFRHTVFKLMVYGIFRTLRCLCRCLPRRCNQFSSLLWTRRNRIPCLIAENINDPETVQQIKAAQPDLIVSVSMNQIVKKDILEIPPLRSINVHCAPLPRYGGMSPYVWALAHNEDHSAATIHYMDEGLDTGDIIVQKNIPVKKNDSAFCLFYRCCLKARDLLLNVLQQFETQTVQSYPQDLSKKTYFSWPTRQCVRDLRKHGFRLAYIFDFILAIFKQRPRIS